MINVAGEIRSAYFVPVDVPYEKDVTESPFRNEMAASRNRDRKCVLRIIVQPRDAVFRTEVKPESGHRMSAILSSPRLLC